MDLIIILAAIIILILATGCLKNWSHESTRNFSYSLIIACRNEENNLPTLFSALEKLDYPNHKYEIILIDHGSVDNTKNMLRKFCQNNSNRKMLHVKQEYSDYKGKKQALQAGVESSQNEILLFTDADCLPPADWLEQMNNYINEKTGMVVGYSPENTTNEFRNFTQLMSATFYCSTIGLGVPFSSNGRNLALKKSVFDEVKGFTRIKQHPCGEDKQLLQLVDKTEYKIAYNAKNKVYTKPVTDEFSDQKKRRYGQFGISTPFYKFASSMIFLFYLYLPITIILGANAVNIFLYFIPLFILWKITLQKHNEKFHPAHIFYLIIYPYYLIFYSIYGMLSDWEWKK